MESAIPPVEAPRRRRNPEATRQEILAAARTVLASDGPDGLSLSKVAQLAGVNRGTAYQHFETREDLIKATISGVSEHLSDAVFGQRDNDDSLLDPELQPLYEIISGMVDFAVENPELGRIWLFEILSSDNPGNDRFFKQFAQATQVMASGEFSEKGIDAEVLSVMMLAGYFLWPVWVKGRACSKKERQLMAQRMRREVLRLLLHGTLNAEAFPHLQKLLDE